MADLHSKIWTHVLPPPLSVKFFFIFIFMQFSLVFDQIMLPLGVGVPRLGNPGFPAVNGTKMDVIRFSVISNSLICALMQHQSVSVTVQRYYTVRGQRSTVCMTDKPKGACDLNLSDRVGDTRIPSRQGRRHWNPRWSEGNT